MQSVAEGGILMVTATDMAVLCGNNGETCWTKYGSYPIHRPYCHEMGVRILLGCIEQHAARWVPWAGASQGALLALLSWCGFAVARLGGGRAGKCSVVQLGSHTRSGPAVCSCGAAAAKAAAEPFCPVPTARPPLPLLAGTSATSCPCCPSAWTST